MIYFFSGDDTEKKILASQKLLKSLPKETEVFFIGEESFDREQMINLYSGSGLFFSKCAVVLRNVMEKDEAESFIIKNLGQMALSENIFIFLEGKKNKPILDAFMKTGGEVGVFEIDKKKETAGEEKFNSFSLANALGVRDKLGLWIYFRQAMQAGVELESLAGILFWKVKDMILKRNFSKFSEAELENLAGKLSYLLPEARGEGRDAEAAFEEFILGI